MTFQYYLGLNKTVEFEPFVAAISDEIMFKVITARRSHLPDELSTYMLYMLDDPSQDEEPILEERHWRDVLKLLGHTDKIESNHDMMKLL